jgi:hypothetical protein
LTNDRDTPPAVPATMNVLIGFRRHSVYSRMATKFAHTSSATIVTDVPCESRRMRATRHRLTQPISPACAGRCRVRRRRRVSTVHSSSFTHNSTQSLK